MKILNTVYGDATGGRWQAMLNTHEALSAKGHEGWLVTGLENQHLIKQSLVSIIRNSGFYDPISAWVLRKFIKKHAIEMVIAHSGRAVYLAKNATLGLNIPIIAMNHSHNVKRSLRADGFIHITPEVQRRVHEQLAKRSCPAKPEKIISNLIHLPIQAPRISEPRTPIMIGMITRLVDYKGVDTLLEAIGWLKNQGFEAKAIIAGDGEYRQALEQLAKTLGISEQVSFLGWIDTQQKQDFYQAIDAIAVPTRNDTQPLAILDAFAQGKPVLCSDHVSCLQMCEHGENALIHPVNDSHTFAKHIQQLQQQQGLARQLATQGLLDAQNQYSFEAVAGQLDAFVTSMRQNQ